MCLIVKKSMDLLFRVLHVDASDLSEVKWDKLVVPRQTINSDGSGRSPRILHFRDFPLNEHELQRK